MKKQERLNQLNNILRNLQVIPLGQLEKLMTNLIDVEEIERILSDDGTNFDGADVDYIQTLSEVLKALYDNSDLDYVFIDDELYDRCITYLSKVGVEVSDSYTINSRLLNDTPHKYPELKGSIDKAKYVYEDDIIDGDKNVFTVEEFFKSVIKKCGLKKSHKFNIAVSFKYDGQSLILDINKKGEIKQALTRGKDGKGANVTHVVQDVDFKLREKVFKDRTGVKVEAIITRSNLAKYNKDAGKDYKNTRSAINGIFNKPEYGEYLSLVVLDYMKDSNRIENVYFTNDIFYSDVEFFYEVFEADYKNLLFLIEGMAKATLDIRPTLNFDIDGLVIEILDEDIREQLGRQGDINQYEIALKFPSEVRQTTLLDVTFEVGYTGNITPVAHYEPVVFSNNTTHKKSTLSSYGKFLEYQFRKGDIIEIKYVNDVICQVFKDHDSKTTKENNNPLIEFPTKCPECDGELTFTERSATCENRNCECAKIGRLVNFAKKMELLDLSEKTFFDLYTNDIVKDMKDILDIPNKQTEITSLERYGSRKFSNMKKEVKDMIKREHFDYMILAAMGIGAVKRTLFKTICSEYNILDDLINPKITNEEIENKLLAIEGIGEGRVKDIMEFRDNDVDILAYMKKKLKIKYTNNMKAGKVIRMTGCRLDKDIQKRLIDEGHDVSDGSVTKKTNILLIPNPEFKSSKIDKANKYGTEIVIIDEFNPDNI